MPRSNLSSSQKSSADEKVKVAGPSNQHCYSSYTTQPYKWIWTKNKNNVLDAPAAASTFARLHLPVSTFIHLCQPASSCVHLCPPQCVTIPSKMLNDTDTFFRYQIFPISIPVLFFGTKYFRYRFRDFFPIPNFTDTGFETFPGTKFFRYQFRYHLNKENFPVPVLIRYWYLL